MLNGEQEKHNLFFGLKIEIAVTNAFKRTNRPNQIEIEMDFQ